MSSQSVLMWEQAADDGVENKPQALMQEEKEAPLRSPPSPSGQSWMARRLSSPRAAGKAQASPKASTRGLDKAARRALKEETEMRKAELAQQALAGGLSRFMQLCRQGDQPTEEDAPVDVLPKGSQGAAGMTACSSSSAGTTPLKLRLAIGASDVDGAPAGIGGRQRLCQNGMVPPPIETRKFEAYPDNRYQRESTPPAPGGGACLSHHRGDGGYIPNFGTAAASGGVDLSGNSAAAAGHFSRINSHPGMHHHHFAPSFGDVGVGPWGSSATSSYSGSSPGLSPEYPGGHSTTAYGAGGAPGWSSVGYGGPVSRGGLGMASGGPVAGSSWNGGLGTRLETAVQMMSPGRGNHHSPRQWPPVIEEVTEIEEVDVPMHTGLERKETPIVQTMQHHNFTGGAVSRFEELMAEDL